MSIRIQGLGWVTPLGRDLATVRLALQAGREAPASSLENPFNKRAFPVRPVAPEIVADVARQPRLRRSSALSLFAVAAAQDAMRDAGEWPAADRLALVFASTNGGVIYTRRFFDDVSKSGTHAGSPVFFPETVYNAPASHIAALLGIEGVATTLVNDATAAADALSAAVDLLEADACDRCIVVAAEEADWVLCEAYAAWNIAPIFSEGAAAVVLGRDGAGPLVESISPGAAFASEAEAQSRLAGMAAAARPDLVVSSAGGAGFDAIEAKLPAAPSLWTPRSALGEAFAASAMMQVVTAVLALRETPGRAFVPFVGFQRQIAAVTLRARAMEA